MFFRSPRVLRIGDFFLFYIRGHMIGSIRDLLIMQTHPNVLFSSQIFHLFLGFLGRGREGGMEGGREGGEGGREGGKEGGMGGGREGGRDVMAL